MTEQFEKRIKQSAQGRREMLAQWRSQRTHEITTPSGLILLVQDVGLEDLALTGRIPNVLVDIMLEADEKQRLNKTEANSDEGTIKKLLTEHPQEFTQMLNELVKATVVEPKIGEVADEDHILLTEIPSGDKMFIFNFLTRDVQQVRPFRDEAESVEAVQPGQDVRAETEFVHSGNGNGMGAVPA